jgi:hypothetical protein
VELGLVPPLEGEADSDFPSKVTLEDLLVQGPCLELESSLKEFFLYLCLALGTSGSSDGVLNLLLAGRLLVAKFGVSGTVSLGS